MKSLSLKARLLLLVGSLLLLLVAAAAFTVFRMKASNESLASLYEDRVTSLELLKHVGDAYNDIVDIAHKAGSASLPTPEAAAQLKAAQAKAHKSWTAYLATPLDDKEAVLVKQLVPLMVKADDVTGQLAAALGRDDVDGVFKLAANGLYPVIDPVADVVDKLASVQLEAAGQEYHAAQKLYAVVL